MNFRQALPYVFGAVLLSFLILWLGRTVAEGSLLLPFAIVGSLFAAMITLIRPDAALLILVFSMLLSPEITVAELPRRAVVLRVDDFLLVTIFLVWLVKTSLQKGLGFFVKTPLNRPVLAYAVICLLATAKGALFGDISATRGAFYVFKYIEFFFLYFMVANLLETKRQARLYLWAGSLTAVIVCLFAYAHIGKVPRLYAPFDSIPGSGGAGESATLGGYLLIVMSVCLGFFTQMSGLKNAVLSLGLLGFCLTPFVLTLSRASYAAFIFSVLGVVLFGRRKSVLLLSSAVLMGILFPHVSPGLYEAMMERLRQTFQLPYDHLKVAGWEIGLEASAAQRVNSWVYAFTLWLPKHPFLGHGVTGVGLVDAQYPLVLGETGLFGFAAFLWLLGSLFRHSLSVFRRSVDGFDRGVSIGFLAAFLGLCVQALTTNTFIIVRIMEPFWFLAAIVMRLPALRDDRPTAEAAPAGVPAPRLSPRPAFP